MDFYGKYGCRGCGASRDDPHGGACPAAEAERLRAAISELVADYTYPEHWKEARARAAVPLDRVKALLDD